MVVRFLDLNDLEKKNAILRAMEGEKRTTAARIAVKLDDEAYRLKEARRPGRTRYEQVKNEVRLLLNMMLRDGLVKRSEERAWYGNYYWWLEE